MSVADFGGLWVDDIGDPHIALVGNAPELRKHALAAGLSRTPVFHDVKHSEADLERSMAVIARTIEADADSLGIEFNWVGVSIPDNAIVVNHRSGSAADKRQIRERFGHSVVFEASNQRLAKVACTRQNCSNPLKAGLQLYKNSSSTACMSAFVMYYASTYWIASAGHCFDGSTNLRYHPAGTSIGTTFTSFHQVATPIDAMLISIPASKASNKLFVTSTLIRSVTSMEATLEEVIGQSVCSSRLSGVSCGQLLNTNVCTEYGVCDQRYASNQYACGGDSGSPVYRLTGSTAKAMGIIVAGTVSTTCGSQGSNSVYTHIHLVVMASGTAVKTN